MIRIANSCIGKNNSFDALPKTTKEDKTMHGWGLQNVQQTVQKYGGNLKFRQEENQFIVDVMMFFEGETEEEKEIKADLKRVCLFSWSKRGGLEVRRKQKRMDVVW